MKQVEKTELTNAQKQNRVRQRISQASIDPDKYEYIPAKASIQLSYSATRNK